MNQLRLTQGRARRRPAASPRTFLCWLGIAVTMTLSTAAHAGTSLPAGFVLDEVVAGLDAPSYINFSPDGRLFISERIEGKLRVATYDGNTDSWLLEPTPYATFDVPHDGTGVPVAHNSSGLRDITFDPDFAVNGYIYAYTMRHAPRHNHVVRITQDPTNPNVALAGSELQLFELPFNGSSSSGSHNGSAMMFGADGKLYFTTGDGFTGGDTVQSLSTYTGKVFRINPDGSIPTDNPFYTQATGTYRGIYALGLRNPFTLSHHPDTGELFIHDVVGGNKAQTFILAPGANYGHQGTGGGGTPATSWAQTGGSGARVIGGGVWLPENGPWPPPFAGSLIVSLWNGGRLDRVTSRADNSTQIFAADVSSLTAHGPASVKLGPDGALYYLLTTYQTDQGGVYRLRYTPLVGDLFAHFPLDETAGGTATDSVGGAVIGNLGGQWQPAGGAFAGAVEFDGVDDRLEGPLAATPGVGFAASLWVNPDDFEVTDARLLSKATGVAESEHWWMLSTFQGSAVRFRVKAGGTTTTLVSPTGQLTPGAWSHVCGTYDGARMRLYIDAVEVASVTKTGAPDLAPAVVVALGNQPSGAGERPFDGRIDDVKLFSRTVSPGEAEVLAGLTESFIRGDCNGDAGIDISDPIRLLTVLFPTGAPPAPLGCLDACDGNDDGSVDVADAVVLLGALFGSTGAPTLLPASCGFDDTSDVLDCDSFSPCL